jgi:cobalamin-dependent methionine synthase I
LFKISRMSVKSEKPQVVQLSNVDIPVKAVLRRFGYPAEMKRVRGEINRILRQEVGRASELIHAQGVYRLMGISSRTGCQIRFQNLSFVIESCQVAKMLKSSDPIVLFMVTLGPVLEEEVKRLFERDETTRGVVLDAIGSETADAVADKLHHVVLKQLAEKEGYSVTPRFSPGYGDWPLTIQRDLLKVCEGKRIGISVNDSFLMIPRKSVSAVFGWERKQ